MTNLGLGIFGELVRDDHVRWEHEVHTCSLSLLHEVAGQRNQVLLHHGCAHRLALGPVEGEDHPASDDNVVALGQERLDDRHLGRDLCPANDGRQRGHRSVNYDPQTGDPVDAPDP